MINASLKATAKKKLFIALILIVAACGTFKEERTYSKNGLTVTYRSFSRIGNDITDYQIQRSANLTAEMVSLHLLSLWHRKIEPPGKAKPVFSKKQVGELAPLLVKAFRKVKLNKYLHFEYRSPKGLTEGDVFASLDKLH